MVVAVIGALLFLAVLALGALPIVVARGAELVRGWAHG